MSVTDDPRPLDAATAANTIATLEAVEARLAAADGTHILTCCLHWAKEAVWTAAYPGQSGEALHYLAAQAENAMG